MIATLVALALVMVFAGAALGHHTLPSATFACDGTVSWHVDDWTTDNTNNQALASDVEVWYSLDGGSYVKIGDFQFDVSNYLTGFGGSFGGGSAASVTIKVNLKSGTTWGDGNATSTGPWFSTAVGRMTCPPPTPVPSPTPVPAATPTPSTTPAPTVTPTPSASSSPSSGVHGATGTPGVRPPPTSTTGSADGSPGSSLPIAIAALVGLALAALFVTYRHKVSFGKHWRS